MRWDDLFADLAAEATGLDLAERDAEIADATRAELARIRLVDRCRAGVGREVRVDLTGAGRVHGRLARVTRLWLLLRPEASTDPELLVPVHAVLSVHGLPARTVPPGQEGVVESALSWAQTWRLLVRDRSRLKVVRTDGQILVGTAERAGSDFVEIATDRAPVLVPYQAVALLHCPV